MKNLHDVGFEPTKAKLRDLKPRPFDHSGNHALTLYYVDNALGQF